MEQLIFSPISIGELKSVISETVESELKKITLQIQNPELTELITRKETAKLLGITLVTLSEWQKSGKIPAYRIGTRVRYKRAEVLNALRQIETKSLGEVA